MSIGYSYRAGARSAQYPQLPHGLLFSCRRACRPAFHQATVADGTGHAALDHVPKADPGTGVMRHMDTGQDEAIECAEERSVDIPMA